MRSLGRVSDWGRVWGVGILRPGVLGARNLLEEGDSLGVRRKLCFTGYEDKVKVVNWR